jgi:hypothetical protein
MVRGISIPWAVCTPQQLLGRIWTQACVARSRENIAAVVVKNGGCHSR